jgi:hypothetical protein
LAQHFHLGIDFRLAVFIRLIIVRDAVVVTGVNTTEQDGVGDNDKIISVLNRVIDQLNRGRDLTVGMLPDVRFRRQIAVALLYGTVFRSPVRLA